MRIFHSKGDSLHTFRDLPGNRSGKGRHTALCLDDIIPISPELLKLSEEAPTSPVRVWLRDLLDVIPREPGNAVVSAENVM